MYSSFFEKFKKCVYQKDGKAWPFASPSFVSYYSLRTQTSGSCKQLPGIFLKQAAHVLSDLFLVTLFSLITVFS